MYDLLERGQEILAPTSEDVQLGAVIPAHIDVENLIEGPNPCRDADKGLVESSILHGEIVVTENQDGCGEHRTYLKKKS